MADNTYYEEEDIEELEEQDSKNNDTQPSMTESQILNYIIDTGKFDIIKKGNLDETYFPGYGEEFNFIKDHYTKYQVVPDVSTFIAKFPDFDLFEINESEQAMIESIKEEKAYTMIAPTLNDINKKAANNAIEATNFMKEKAEEILKEVNIIRYKPGYDIFIQAHERAEEYRRKLNLKGILGCMANIPKIDEVTHGWISEDFVALTARIQQGKSWISEYLALMPWLHQGKKIGLWSLENPKSLVGYRADTLLKHFSNDGLVSGKTILRWQDQRPSLTSEDYFDYIEAAASYGIPFEVYDNNDSADGFWTIESIGEVIESKGYDLIVIDQLSLLGVLPKVKSIREGYVHTTRYTRAMVNRIQRPVILNCQSGREAAKIWVKDKEATPELHQIAESDSVGQDATKVLSLVNLDGLLKVSLKKNTMGRSNIDAILKWDIDLGVLEPLHLEEGDPNPESQF
jgi:replicative DNA helicase